MELEKKKMKRFVLGIDAAWSDRNPSGICLLSLDGDRVELERIGASFEQFEKNAFSFEKKPNGQCLDIGRLLSICNENVELIAIDMPISNGYITGRRSCDNEIAKAYGARGASTHSPTKNMPGLIALNIMNEAKKEGFVLEQSTKPLRSKTIFEVYPHTAIIEYFNLSYRLAYKVGKRSSYKEWVNLTKEEKTMKLVDNLNFLLKGLSSRILNLHDFIKPISATINYKLWQLKAYEDCIDAVLCALVGVDHLTGKTKGYGDSEGSIWVPLK